MNSAKRLKSLPPPIGTDARRKFDEQKRGYRHVQYRGFTVKETLNRKTGLWSKLPWVSEKQRASAAAQLKAAESLPTVNVETLVKAEPEFSTIEDAPPG